VHNIQPLLNKTYIKAVKAKGVYIYDEHGKTYLDGSSGAVTCSLGHSHEKVLSFIKNQVDKLQFVYRSQFASEEAEQLATKLFELSPGKSLKHTFFVNSGTEAIETVMKIALQYWQEKGLPDKKRFITRCKSYHGITMGALSLSGHALRRQRFESMLEKYPLLSADLEIDSLEIQVNEFEKVITPKTKAIMICNPSNPTGYLYTKEELQSLADIVQKHDLFLFTDEVYREACGCMEDSPLDLP
jgi:adenosylmethionine-8-amino-7-oxononanoate aminotransferase